MSYAAPLALVAGGIGAGVSAVGGIEGGQATANAAHYSAQVARNNAIIANQNADYSIAAGQQKAAVTSLKGAAVGGQIKAGQAASGVDVNTGSSVKVQEGQREAEKLDTDTMLSNAQLQAYGYRSQATSFTSEAELEDMKAEQAPIGADLGALGGFLSNVSSLGSKYKQGG